MTKTQLIENTGGKFIKIRPAEKKHKRDKAEERHLIPMMKGYDRPLELCLCGRCAGAFYNLEDHIIRRVDYDQCFKDKCDTAVSDMDMIIWCMKGAQFKV